MIKIGILGYGNLGRGVQKAVVAAPDMQLDVIFSKRPDSVNARDSRVELPEKISSYAGKLDVLVCCGGSATDLPIQTPMVASMFNFVDSFDNHAEIVSHFKNVDAAAKKSGTAGVISAGWDPGLFSLQRLYGETVLSQGKTYTFWGEGVSQGHSQALRRLNGVLDAVQYTLPIKSALEQVRKGNQPDLTAREKHTRVCFVVAENGASQAEIKEKIVSMPDYFAPYDTEVNFVSADEFNQNHKKMPHGGFVFRTGNTEKGCHTIEYSLKLSDNPEFTGSVLCAYARAVARLAHEKAVGARTVLDVPPSYLSPKTALELYKELL